MSDTPDIPGPAETSETSADSRERAETGGDIPRLPVTLKAPADRRAPAGTDADIGEHCVTVMDTPRWSCKQALLSALEQCDDWESVAIIGAMRNEEDNGTDFPSVTGGRMATERLHFMGRVLQVRAERDEDEEAPREPDSPAA